MIAWCAAFVGVGLAFIPLVGAVTGGKGGFAGLSAADKSAFALVNQIMETVVSIGVIRLGVAKFEPLPAELFKYDFRCEAARGGLLWLWWWAEWQVSGACQRTGTGPSLTLCPFNRPPLSAAPCCLPCPLP
jgi:hypothetical protein